MPLKWQYSFLDWQNIKVWNHTLLVTLWETGTYIHSWRKYKLSKSRDGRGVRFGNFTFEFALWPNNTAFGDLSLWQVVCKCWYNPLPVCISSGIPPQCHWACPRAQDSSRQYKQKIEKYIEACFLLILLGPREYH